MFVRCGAGGQPEREIRANVRAVTATEFATVLGDAAGPLCLDRRARARRAVRASASTTPSSRSTDRKCRSWTAARRRSSRRSIRPASSRCRRRAATSEILKPVRVAKGDCYGELRPHPQGFRVELEIDFDHPLIGRQAIALDVEPETFRRELARARTFGFMRDVAKLWSAGYALGASFENTLVVNDDRLLNPDGLRFADEFARHKALDAIGDLALAGAPLLGAYRSVRGGHKLNHAVLSALMADPSAWVLVEGPELRPEIRQETRQEAPRRAIRGHADLATGLVAPAYGPDVS